MLGPLVFAIASIWKLVAMVRAIRQAFAYSSIWRAVGVAVVGFISYAVVSSIVYALAESIHDGRSRSYCRFTTREARAVTHRLALNGQVITSLDPSTVPGLVKGGT